MYIWDGSPEFCTRCDRTYYQNVPLFVLTADRPPEWIDQWDGQTIRQKNLYIEHIKGCFVYDEDTTSVGKKALELALEGALGPVHLNIPIREPFYPDSFEEIRFNEKAQRPQSKNIYKIDELVWDEFESILNLSEKVLVLGGQTEPNQELIELLNQLDIPIVGDVISNLHGLEGVINSSDLIFKTDDEFLAPDFLITFGRSVISKNLKLYLRKNKPKVHWHIGEGMVGDPFQSLTKIIKTPPLQFFTDWLDMVIKINDQDDYCNLLKDTQKSVDEDFDLTLDNAEFNYFNAVRSVLKQLPQNSVLHLGNSMPVRIANFIGIKESTIDIWCNRGTSGIDGVVSTAVGHALAEPNRKHTLIIGDLSFFYDRNGLWLNHEFPTNMQIVILNDSGGGIFNIIPGPPKQNGLTDLFTTPHQRTAKLTAQEFNLTYRKITSLEEIDGWSSGILEIFTEMQNNMETFKRITTKARRKLN